MMMAEANAILEERDGVPTLRFERVLRHSPEQVWRALTDPEEQLGWHPTPARFELEVGGRVEYLDGGYVSEMAEGEVTACEPQRLLAYSWNTGASNHLSWELRPHDEGCLLILLQGVGDRRQAPSFGAGWEICLDALPAAIDGSRERPRADRQEPPWPELNAAYERRFGIRAD